MVLLKGSTEDRAFFRPTHDALAGYGLKPAMAISWYPGHMVTARKEAAVAMRRTDLVIEMLDARAPHASCNPMLETLRKELDRPALKLLNKSDVADPEQTHAWISYYNSKPGVKAIALTARKPGDAARILKVAQAMIPGRGTTVKPLRMMILGIPNVGKSTLMNALLKRHVANVGDEPAITKIHMSHKLGDTMMLIDTPGLMWPGIAHESAVKLAATHSIGRNAYDDGTIAAELGRYILVHYPQQLTQRYGSIPPETKGEGIVEYVARSRNLLLKAGVLDLNKAAMTLLNDFRSGALGRVTLERVGETL
ncbi:MAG: ribosome biogenesis GTPase YlqF [Deltaproteobacteria bacterium]|nr:ribosome biogenesis GTPase YlqF [Deltaproteobacteria bacterium]